MIAGRWPSALAVALAAMLARGCGQGETDVPLLAFEADTGRVVGEAGLEWSPRELGPTTRPTLPYVRALLDVPEAEGSWSLEFATGAPAGEKAAFRLAAEDGDGAVFFEVVDGGPDGRWVPRRVRLPRGGRYRLDVLPAGVWARRLGRQPPEGSCLSLPRLVAAEAGASRDERPNLLLISADTLRADRLGCYGADRATSPEIDRLAAEGILVERVYAASNWTLPSHYSLFTGLDPSAHGVDPDLVEVGLFAEVWGGMADREPGRAGDGDEISGRPSLSGSGQETTLAEVLRAAGYRTRAFTEAGWVSARFGLDQGFDAYDSDTGRVLERTRERGLAWLRENAERGPWFLFVHSYEVHQPYHAPESHRSRFLEPDHVGFALPGALVPLEELNRFKSPAFPPTEGDVAAFRSLYDAGVLYLDGLVGDLRRALEDAGVERRTIVVLTSDHGEELFERGGFDHIGSLREEVARVPLIVWAPGRLVPPGTRLRGGPVSLTDLGNTLLGLLEVAAEQPVGLGRDLSSFLGPGAPGGSLPDGAVFAESRGESSEPVQAVWENGPDGWWKYLRKETRDGVRERLYELRADPGENRDLSSTRADRVARLREALLRRRAAADAVREALGGGEAVALDEESLEALRELGYVQ